MRNARNMNTHLDEDALSDISEVSEDCPQIIMIVRNIRTSNPEDMLTDEKAEQVLRILEEVIQCKANKKQDEKTKAVSKLWEVFTDTQHALDVAFSAGTLATQTGCARADSVKYATNLPDERAKEVFG